MRRIAASGSNFPSAAIPGMPIITLIAGDLPSGAACCYLAMSSNLVIIRTDVSRIHHLCFGRHYYVIFVAGEVKCSKSWLVVTRKGKGEIIYLEFESPRLRVEIK
jgi:hypothetical protein